MDRACEKVSETNFTASPPDGLPTPLSLYLDLARFGAAMTVFLGHLGTQRMTGGWLWQVNRYVDLGLMVFFVLSGFVIAHVTATRERDPRRFAASRLARLYSVVLPALLLTAALDLAGAALGPAGYPPPTAQHESPYAYLASALFLHQAWFLDLHPGTNLPYWSLGPEAFFYAAFGLARFAGSLGPGAIALAVGGPTIAALFPLWLLGYALYRWRPRVPQALAWLLLALSIAALFAEPSIRQATHGLAIPLVRRSAPLADYAGAIAFALHLIAIRALAHRMGWIGRIAGPARWLGSLTFALYLFHFPVALFLTGFFPGEGGSALRYAVVAGGTFLVAATLGRWCEARKGRLRAAIERLPPFRARPS